MTEQVEIQNSGHVFGYRLAVLTDVGKKRSENQDAFGYGISSKAALYVVADGMGGARGGAVASAIAVHTILQKAFRENGEVDSESLRGAITSSNKFIFSRSQEDPNLFGMGTTVASLCVSGNVALFSHVGDSRIYRLLGGELKQLTKDHTLVQELVDTGTIPEAEAASHPISHMLTRSLGPTEIIRVDAQNTEAQLRGGERFLICSDGLYNHVTFDKIRELLASGSPEIVARKLIDHALDGGGTDNVTALVLEISREKHGPDIQEIPTDAEVRRTYSRELPPSELEEEKKSNFSGAELRGQVNPNAHLNGSGTADVLKALPEVRTAKAPWGVAVVLIGLVAGILLFLNRGSEDEGPVVSPPKGETQREEPLALLLEPTPQRVGDADSPTVGQPVAASEVKVDALGLPVEVPEKTPALPENRSQTTPVTLLEPVPEESAEPSSTGGSLPVTPTEGPVGGVNSEPTPSVSVATPPPETVVEQLKYSNFDETPGIPVDFLVRSYGLEIPKAPRLDVEELSNIEELSPDSQIVWEHESQKLAKLLVENRARRVTEAVEYAQVAKTKIFAEGELEKIATEKDQVRRRIAEIDGKTSFLLISDKAQAQKRAKQIEKEVASFRKQAASKQGELAKWEQAFRSWKIVKDQSLSADTVKLAESAEKFSDPIREALAAFRKASDTYTSSLSKWQNQALDTQATAVLAQLGRDARARRLDLENSVRSEVQRGWSEAREQVVRSKIEIFGLERQKDLQVKLAGYAAGFAPVKGGPRVELYRKYLSERSKLLKHLKDLQQTLDDEAELDFRVQELAKSL